jgi:hypothetical protein
MSTIFNDISAALDQQLGSLAGTTPIAWTNSEYTPTKGTMFLRPTNLPAPTLQGGLGTSGLDVNVGIYQVDVVGMVGTGKGLVAAKVDAVADHFSRGTDLTYNGVTVRLGNVSHNAGLIDGDRYYVSVSIQYRVYTTPR